MAKNNCMYVLCMRPYTFNGEHRPTFFVYMEIKVLTCCELVFSDNLSKASSVGYWRITVQSQQILQVI